MPATSASAPTAPVVSTPATPVPTSVTSSVPATVLCPRSPPVTCQNPHIIYEPPSQTTTCSGHVVQPPQCYDLLLH
ncbi:hypothetical protein A0H81_05819 [Grifola frondosa]|uniref:Uncharacterized protein n=1 Tax=Grifola frondosa TaxID=5627 RepID=A0A1C7MAB9_GRIFR|nr:hypothetical protein A0H81_05819 [Grifola frondosa]